MPVSAQEARDEFRQAGFRILSITDDHAIAVETSPMLHGDPFDRLIIPQALIEPARLLTRNRAVAAYSNSIIAVCHAQGTIHLHETTDHAP
jgi:PIN domain nuclease of toxin-antitoxin system